MMDEWFELVDEEGRVTGKARRSECHGNPNLMHPVVHVLVFDAAKRLFLQKRAAMRDIQPGKWDSSVGGHMRPGEHPQDAARRETREELGVDIESFCFAYRYVWRSEIETELVHTFFIEHDGPFFLQQEEIEEGRFWTGEEILQACGKGRLTRNFELEYKRFRDFTHTGEGVNFVLS